METSRPPKCPSIGLQRPHGQVVICNALLASSVRLSVDKIRAELGLTVAYDIRGPLVELAAPDLPKHPAQIEELANDSDLANRQEIFRETHVRTEGIQLRRSGRSPGCKQLGTSSAHIAGSNCYPPQDDVPMVDSVAEIPITEIGISQFEQFARMCSRSLVIASGERSFAPIRQTQETRITTARQVRSDIHHRVEHREGYPHKEQRGSFAPGFMLTNVLPLSRERRGVILACRETVSSGSSAAAAC